MTEIVIGVDVGGTTTKFGIVDAGGNCLAEDFISTRSQEKLEDFLQDLYKAIDKLIKGQTDPVQLKGIGIGAPNGNYYTGSIEFAPNLLWKGVIPLAKYFKEHYQVPSVLTNDANAAAIGELLYGGANGMKDFIVITIGTGLGSGLVVNGQLVYGHDGFAGEIGHTIINPDGRQCTCGRKGCLEAYVSIRGIRQSLQEILSENDEPSPLRDKKPEEISPKDIFEAAAAGDSLAILAFDRTGKSLGLALSNSVSHTSPEAIFLSGGIAQAGKFIFEPTKRYLESYLLNVFQNKVRILPSSLRGQDSAILGAAALVWKEICPS